jgi:hypothetical protein
VSLSGLVADIVFGLTFGLLFMAATIGGMKDRYGLLVAGFLVVPVVVFLVGPPTAGGTEYPGSALAGLLFVVLWGTAGARLGKPWSVWARTFYDSERMAIATARFPSRAGLPIRPLPVRPPRPGAVEMAYRLLLVICVGLVPSNPFAGMLAGPLFAFTLMTRAGHHWARITVTVLVGLFCGLELFALVRTWPYPTVLPLVLLLPIAGMLVLLYRPEANRFYRVRDTTSEPGTT